MKATSAWANISLPLSMDKQAAWSLSLDGSTIRTPAAVPASEDMINWKKRRNLPWEAQRQYLHQPCGNLKIGRPHRFSRGGVGRRRCHGWRWRRPRWLGNPEENSKSEEWKDESYDGIINRSIPAYSKVGISPSMEDCVGNPAVKADRFLTSKRWRGCPRGWT